MVIPMIKKIFITLILISPLGFVQAITVNEIVDKASALWSKEKQIKKPDFSLIDIEGNTYTDESTDGKYLIINFWATWCPPCLKEIPAFVDFFDNNSEKVLVIGLDYEQADKKSIVEFTNTFLVSYPIVMFDKHNGPQFSGFGDVFGMPTTYVYNPEGKLVDFKMGEVDTKFLENAILK